MRKFLISLISIIFIISIMTAVYAATGTISVGSSADTVIKGKTFTVTLAATADSPIDGMKTKFSYDKNILSLETSTAGDNYGNNSSEGEILVTSNADTSPTSTTLYTMTFKVLDTANVESTTISFSESELHLKTEETIEKFSTTVDKVTINIKADDTTAGGEKDPSNGDNGNGGTDNGNTGSGNTGSGKENENKNVNKKPSKLPQTGVESTVLIAIVALGAVSIVSYVSYKKYNNI